MEPIATTRKATAIRKTIRAKQYETTAYRISVQATVKSMLRSLTKEADDEIVVEEPPEITQAIFDAKKAVYHSAEFVPPKGKEKKNDRDPTLKYDDEVSDTALEKFTIIGKDAKHLLTPSLHLGLVTDVCGYLTVVDLFVGLDADLCRAVQLAKAY